MNFLSLFKFPSISPFGLHAPTALTQAALDRAASAKPVKGAPALVTASSSARIATPSSSQHGSRHDLLAGDFLRRRSGSTSSDEGAPRLQERKACHPTVAAVPALKRSDLPADFTTFWTDAKRSPAAQEALYKFAQGRYATENLDFLIQLEAMQKRVAQKQPLSVAEASAFARHTHDEVNVPHATRKALKEFQAALPSTPNLTLEQSKTFLDCLEKGRSEVCKSFGDDNYRPFLGSLKE